MPTFHRACGPLLIAIAGWLLLAGLFGYALWAAPVLHEDDQQPSLPSIIIAYGKVEATEMEAAEGYFKVGRVTMIAVKPGTIAHHQMLALQGKTVEVVMRVVFDADGR